MAEYIEKSVVLNALIDVENRAQGDYQKSGESLYRDLCDTEIRLGKIPSADVAPVVHARWIHTNSLCDLFCEVWQCSCCSAEDENGVLYNFCPNCGAKMDLEELQ